MVYIYAASVRELPDPMEQPNLLEGFPDERKQKILRYRQKDDRIQSFGASLLLQTILKKYGKSLDDIRFGENGKPEIEELFFNLSHSHDMVVCAVSDKAVGCDVEKIEEIKDGIARRFFCENEMAHLEGFTGQKKKSEFIRIWTMKESYMKMTGEGMKLALNRFEFLFEESIKVYRDGELCSCYVKEYVIPGYKLSVCAEESEFAEEIEYIKLYTLY